MAIVCPLCGAENRDKARFCRGCAHALDLRPEAASGEPAGDRGRGARRARRRKSSARDEPRPAWSRWALVLTVATVALGVGWWLGAHQKTPAPALAASPASVVAHPTPPTPGESVNALSPSIVQAPPVPAAAAVDRLRESVQRLEQEDRLREAALAQQRPKSPHQKRFEEARRHSDTLPAGGTPAAGLVAPPQGAPEVPAVVAAAPVDAVPASKAAPANVDQLCADSGNVFARDFCRIRECGKPVFAADPVCVRFRQMEEARGKEMEYR
jgi:ribosomal protein L40E